jgi:hypothetical protein
VDVKCDIYCFYFVIEKGERSAIVVAGGMVHDNGPTASVEVFLASKNVWIALPDMVRPRSWYPSLAILGTKLVCVGGKVY